MDDWTTYIKKKRHRCGCRIVFLFVQFLGLTIIASIPLGLLFETKYAAAIICLYLFWSYDFSEYKCGRPWEFIARSWPFRLAVNYFPIKAHKLPFNEKEIPQFILGIHPHGMVSEYRLFLEPIFYDIFPNREMRYLAATVLFQIPFIRELVLWTRCIDCSRKTCEYNLEKGISLMLIPGGEREQISTEYQKEKVILKKRYGFVKLAIQNGIPLIPCYTFGVNDMYYSYSWFSKLRHWMVTNVHMGVSYMSGVCGWPLLPFSVPLNVVFGRPIYTTINKSPSRELVQQTLITYEEELRRIFDENKEQFGYENRTLEVM